MKIELHQIKECGFYERGASVPLYGRIGEWLPAFIQWVHGRTHIASTKLSDEQEVYCAGCVLSDSGAGLKLWNATPSTDSGVAFISMGDSPDGMASASEQELPNNSIAGWPGFFWILPDSDLIVTLQHTGRIRNRSTAMPEFRYYLSAYLKTASSYVDREVQRNGRVVQESVIYGYRPLQGGSVRSDLYARFATVPVGLPSELDFIRSKCMNIRKIVSSMQVSRAVSEERSFVERMLHSMAWDSFRSPDKDVIRMHWETDWEPAPEELDETIMRYDGGLSLRHDSRVERIGVKLRGDSRTYWLDSMYAADDVQLPEELEDALDWNRDQFLRAWGYAERQVMALRARI